VNQTHAVGGPASPTPPPSPPPASPTPAPAGDLTTAQLEVYKILATLFNSEETSFWTRNNILVVVHGALIAATAAIVSQSEKVLTPGAPITAKTVLFGSLAVLSFVGLLMAVAWLLMVARSVRIGDTVLVQLRRLEAQFPAGLASQFRAFTTFARQLDTTAIPEADFPSKARTNNVRLSTLWTWVGAGLALLWGLLVIAFAVAVVTLAPAPMKTADADAPPGTVERVSGAVEQVAFSATQAAEAAATAASAAQAAAAQATLAAAAAASSARSAARVAGQAAARSYTRRGRAQPARR
jgi:hypothetical protein